MLGNVAKLEHEEDEDVTQINFKTSGHKLNFRFNSPPSVYAYRRDNHESLFD